MDPLSCQVFREITIIVKTLYLPYRFNFVYCQDDNVCYNSQVMARERRSTNSAKRNVKKTSPVKKISSKKTPVKNATTRQPITSSVMSTPVTTNARNPRLWIGLVIVILAILAFAFKGLFIAAIVNGQPVSRVAVIQQLEQQNGKQAVSDLITKILITQEAQKRNVTVNQSEVDSDLKNIDGALKAQGQTLDTALASRGMSKQQLVDQITLQKLVEKMVGKDVKVTDDDVQKYIDTNKDNLPQDLSDDDLKKQVKAQLQQQQLQEKTQAFVADLQKKANISYFVNY